MTRSIQRSHCQHSCWMCDPGKREPGRAKPSDLRRAQNDGTDEDYSHQEFTAERERCERECCRPAAEPNGNGNTKEENDGT